jgi:threonine aldolase
MVFVSIDNGQVANLVQELGKEGILISGRTGTIRLVTHFDVKARDIDRIATTIARAVKTL